MFCFCNTIASSKFCLRLQKRKKIIMIERQKFAFHRYCYLNCDCLRSIMKKSIKDVESKPEKKSALNFLKTLDSASRSHAFAVFSFCMQLNGYLRTINYNDLSSLASILRSISKLGLEIFKLNQYIYIFSEQNDRFAFQTIIRLKRVI